MQYFKNLECNGKGTVKYKMIWNVTILRYSEGLRRSEKYTILKLQNLLKLK